MILNNFHKRQQSTSADVNSDARRSLHQRRESTQFPLPSPRQPTTPNILITEPNGPTYDVESPSEKISLDDEPTWLNMPNKRALAILALSRLVDFWQMASLQSYMVEQLRSFDIGIPTASLSYQAGVLQGSFTFAQIVTSILWGRAADSPVVGRRTVLLIGLLGTGISCIGVAFSRSFIEMVTWRVLGGAINGTVGAARTMVAESVDRKWHSRAFLLLPVAFNVANILGPVVGGALVHPISTYPGLFDSTFGSSLLEAFPYALPSLLCTALLFTEAGLVITFLEETLTTKRHDRSFINQLTDMYHGIVTVLLGRGSEQQHKVSEKRGSGYQTVQLPFRKIWTPNVLWTLLSVAIFDLHMGAFSGLWIIFLSTPRSTPEHTTHTNAIHFTGGLSFSPSLLGSSLAILGIVGLILQVLLYPWANARFGLMRCFRYSLLMFPLAYFLAPYLALLPSTTALPQPASGALIWLGIFIVLTLQVSARTFALPASIILVNNASPHPSVLGTIHGVGQSVSSAMRTLGPVAGGYWFGLGLEKGMVGLGWWAIAGISALGCIASLWVKNGSGYEVVLQEEDSDRRSNS